METIIHTLLAIRPPEGNLGRRQGPQVQASHSPKDQSYSVRLWEGEDYLGLIPGDVVVRDHLRPGYMLWLRDDPPTKNRPAPPAGYDYEVRALDIAEPYEYKHRDVGGLRAREYYLTASQSAAHLRDRLRMAYRFLDGGLRRQARQSEAKFLRRQGKEVLNVTTIPFEFHLKASSPPKPVRPGRHGADWSLFTKDRVDLHPAVILRALPEGVFQLLEPVADVEAGDALWLVATDDLEARPYRMPETPWAKQRKAKKMVRIKREQVAELIEAGKIKADGKMGSQARPGRASEEWVRKGEERRRKGDQPDTIAPPDTTAPPDGRRGPRARRRGSSRSGRGSPGP